MSVKIELEPKEVGQIINALNCYRDEKEKIIKSGKYMGKKVSAAGVSIARNVKSDLEKLIDFFESAK
jgi:hypothetical protein